VRHYVAALALLLPRSFNIISNMENYKLTQIEQEEYQEYEKEMQDQLLEDIKEIQQESQA
jgi:uncharacterized protein (UPF0305 family)